MKLSIIIPAFNEEKNLANSMNDLFSAIKKAGGISFSDCEFLIFDDCSIDKTGDIADLLAKENPSIKVIHNNKNMGLGYNFKEGVRLASGEYVTFFPGDNENCADSFVRAFGYIGKTDIVITYTSNKETRSMKRRVISKLYTMINNFLFGLNLKYYNGLSVYRKDSLLLILPLVNHSFAFSTEILVRFIKLGCSYVEVPIKIKTKNSEKTSAFKIKNIFGTVKAIGFLFLTVKIKYKNTL